MSSPTVYLVSGATRGLGLGFVTALSLRPNTIVYAGARDPFSATKLQELADAHPGVVKIVKLESALAEDAKAAAAVIEKEHGKLDVVIANAGIGKDSSPVADVLLDALDEHLRVNTKGPLVLFQATHSLLFKSDSGKPKFVLISSAGGSIGLSFDMRLAAYGTSKAAANFLLAMMHNEHKDLIALAIEPGPTATDMGKDAAKAHGFGPDFPLGSVEDAVKGVLAVIDNAERGEKAKFLNPMGEELPW
ncbi:short-chain dehydrogenase/reductase SDR family protein [Pseudohyphozyma bogoriensis]|nr:short-chain dehydrogenase/reductase SDR family protein [Pseudohyphozyma bogoriensis]